MKEVILAKSAGFCFGVQRAMNTVYSEADKKNVYTYGPIIHNTEVVKDLESKGIYAIDDISQISDPQNSTVIIRSHGVSKEVYESIKNSGASIVDATCPFVLKIHKIVKDASAAGDQIVIIGNENHPEVEGIMGWSDSPVYVVDSVEKALNLELDSSRKVCVVSQTTFNYKKFQELVEIILKKEYNVCISNTICNATEERQSEARRIARRADAMIVIGDSSSSNTRKLYEICKTECQETFYIQTLSGLELDKLGNKQLAGHSRDGKTQHAGQNHLKDHIFFLFPPRWRALLLWYHSRACTISRSSMGSILPPIS